MKKKMIFAGVAVLLATAAVTGFFAYSRTDVSNLLNANIEALTADEALPTGALWSNQDGTRYCCGPGNVRDCGTSSIPPCP